MALLGPATATVTTDGTVTAVLAGQVTITAHTGAQRGTASLVVARAADPAVASVEVSLSVATLINTGGAHGIAVVRDATGAVVLRTVVWSSSDPSVATVDNGGVVHAVGAGNVVITAESEGVRATSHHGPDITSLQLYGCDADAAGRTTRWPPLRLANGTAVLGT